MNQLWEMVEKKINSMSLRERVLMFATAAVAIVSLVTVFFLNPLLDEQKIKNANLQQQKDKLQTIRLQVETSSEAKRKVANSPLRQRIEQVKQQLNDREAYLQNLHDRLVEPEKMAELLEKVLSHHGSLQLVDMQTLPVAPLVDKAVAKPSELSASAVAAPDIQAFKHGVKLYVRGSYLDLLQYLAELENMPTQMFWGNVEMKVEEYPDVELTLTLYTLSLNKTWLKI